jgi:long-chain acyl-CoA synthetase
MVKLTNKWHVNEEKAWFKKWWPENMPKNIDKFEEISVGAFFERQRKKYGELNLIWFLNSWFTYEETGQLVDKVATGLYNYGLKKGDVCGFLMPNSPQYIICFFACQKLGVIPVGINPNYKHLEILHFAEITNPKAIICLESLYNAKIKPIIDEINILFIITTEMTDFVKGNLSLKDFIDKKIQEIKKPNIDFKPSYNINELFIFEPNLPNVEIDPMTHPAVYLMTGGTTGLPKACINTHFNITSVVKQVKIKFEVEDSGMACIGIGPMFHLAGTIGCINVPVALGAFVVLFPKVPTVEELLQTMDKLPMPQGAFLTTAEIMYKRIADFPDVGKYKNALGKFRVNTCGAGPLHKSVRDKYESVTSGKLVDGYGLTESTGWVSAGPLWTPYPVGTIGLPSPSTDWAIFDPNDFEKGPIADGLPGSKYGKKNSGELCACGPQIFKEYLNQPEETAATLREWDGRIWLLTGDIGYMNEDGTVKLHDRKKQLIKVAGHSVFPTEVESMLLRHECVFEAAVAGLPDPEGKVGEITKAWVIIKDECKNKITENELITWMKENITYWKVPKLIEFIEEIPKNRVGKVQKRALQEADPLWIKK